MAPLAPLIPSLTPSLLLLFTFLPIACASWITYTRHFHPLAKVPGPFLASLTRLWYIHRIRRGDWQLSNRTLHATYGPVVRIAPNELSVADPDAVNIIYGPHSQFTKADFYPTWRPTAFDPKHPDLFTDQDPKHYAARRRLVGGVYTMGSVLESEAILDGLMRLLLDQLIGFAERREALDLGHWLHMYTFDSMSELYFGRSAGCVERGVDVKEYVRTMETMMGVMTVVACLPALYRPVYLLGALLSEKIRRGLATFKGIEKEAFKLVREREQTFETGEVNINRVDFLAKLFQLKADRGEKEEFGTVHIVQEGWVALMAGADTTAITLTSTLHNLLQHPAALTRLRAELTTAALHPPVPYAAAAASLPYLAACIKESMRLHPAVGLTLPRYVPPGGAVLAGHQVPAAVTVGINATVLHRLEEVFGPDADAFRPERWLDPVRAREMDRAMLHFGGASRTCVGKHIAQATMQKLIPTLLLKFDFELVRPGEPLRSTGQIFDKPHGLDVRVVQRSA